MSGFAFHQVRNAWLPLAIVGSLVLLTAWLGQLAHAPKAREAGALGHDPDYFIENFDATAFDVNGNPRYSLSAARMTHYMDVDTTELDAPKFARQGADAPHALVQAKRGLISPRGDEVEFIGDARMVREREAGEPPLELASEQIRVYPELERILADKGVVMKEGRSEVRAAGMAADGKQRTLELKGRVRGVYESRN